MRCGDVEKFVHPYVDGEFEAEDRAPLERHLGECAACRHLVAFQATFKESVCARLRRPEPPPGLRDQVLKALDRADARREGPAVPVWRRPLPIGASLAAAAAVAIFLGTVVTSRAESPIVGEAIRGHEKHLPVEVGGSEDNVKLWMEGKVPVPVRPPRLRQPSVSLVGARVYHLRDRDAAQLVYRVGGSLLTVYVFDPSGWKMNGRSRRIVSNREIFVDGARGYNVLFYRDRGVGYAFTSDLAQDEMIRLVSASLER